MAAAMTLERVRKLFTAAPSGPAGLLDCSLESPPGDTLAVVGPGGAGKTTLLRLVAGLETPDSGRILIDGRDVTREPPHRRDVGLLAQRPALYPHLSIERNLTVGVELRRIRLSADELRSRITEAVELLELAPLLTRRPDQLSGGERQRVAFGRLLVTRPAVWLLDEPFAHLDPPIRVRLRRQLPLLRDRLNATIWVVTHDPVEALALGQRLAVLDAGLVRQSGPASDVYARPAHRFVAAFLGWPPMNLADGSLVRGDAGLRFADSDGTLHLPLPLSLATRGTDGQPVSAGLRPEDLGWLAEGPPAGGSVALPGWRVEAVEPHRPLALATAALGRLRWSFWRGGDGPAPGACGALVYRPDDLHLFDGVTGAALTG
jgi:multiple sugar transport system ATP-binding protein